MICKTRLFTSGPTPLLPAAQFAMAAADMYPDSPEFRSLYMRVLVQLREFIGTRSDVVVLSCSGTGAMEAAVSNVTSPGDRVLVLAAGADGERWVSAAKNFGCAVDVIRVPHGEMFDLAEVKKALKLETRAVFMQACESSTCTQHDVAGVGALLRATSSEALLVVDAMSALGATSLDMDGCGVDVLIGSSEQALMTSPGVAFLAVNDTAWDRMEATYNPRYYFDLRKERKNAQKGESAYTPAVALIAALGAALDYIAAQADGDLAAGRAKLVDNAQVIASMTREACMAMGLKLFSTSPSAAATAVLTPEGIDSGVFLKTLKSRFGAIITNGQGEMQGKLFRIAHIGYVDFMDTMALLAALEQVAVVDLKLPGVKFGTALVAAQTVFAEAAK